MTTALALLGAVLAGFLLYVGLPRLLLEANRRRLRTICRERRVIALSFDDGPGRELTPRVVERLVTAGVPATFFVLGRNARAHPEQFALLAERGFEIGTHGDEHVHHLRIAPWRAIRDTRDAWRILQARLGLDPTQLPFRPTYGKLNLISWLWVRSQGAPIAMWTHDSWDTRPDIDRGRERLIEELRTSGGGVVLLHDFDRDSEAEATRVLERLDAVLELRADGFEFVRVGDLVR
ncbi:MAG: polysaccharide deacetylase family protein [Planctomycetes bacterium]|nr:polysaccharide deacetylase family protein [Planctomycetota bacterium]